MPESCELIHVLDVDALRQLAVKLLCYLGVDTSEVRMIIHREHSPTVMMCFGMKPVYVELRVLKKRRLPTHSIPRKVTCIIIDYNGRCHRPTVDQETENRANAFRGGHKSTTDTYLTAKAMHEIKARGKVR